MLQPEILAKRIRANLVEQKEKLEDYLKLLDQQEIDINTRKPVLANNTGGLSGPAIKPIAVRMVYQAAKAVNIPIMGLGGIVNGEDAIEFMLAGASTISIGCGNFIDPYCAVKTVEQIEEYMKKHNIEDINDIIGKVEMN
jgi:dihydroorotate dehydrogenase (NAD+) catalytic subunit